MIDYSIVYVDEVEDFYQKICRSKPFQSVKFNNEKNYQRLLRFALRKGENDLLALYNLMSLDKKGFIDNIESATFKGYIPGTFNSYYLTNGLLKGVYKRA